jgi:hypothetical protein
VESVLLCNGDDGVHNRFHRQFSLSGSCIHPATYLTNREIDNLDNLLHNTKLNVGRRDAAKPPSAKDVIRIAKTGRRSNSRRSDTYAVTQVCQSKRHIGSSPDILFSAWQWGSN